MDGMTSPPVSVQDLRSYINDSGAAPVSELDDMLAAATEMIEAQVGPILPRPQASTIRDFNGSILVLPVVPVLSVQSVTDAAGAPLATVADLDVDTSAGVINTYGRLWRDRIVVNYTVGRDPVPFSLKVAVMITAGHLYETQRGSASTRPGMLGGGTDGGGEVPMGFALPRRAEELIAPYRTVPAFA